MLHNKLISKQYLYNKNKPRYLPYFCIPLVGIAALLLIGLLAVNPTSTIIAHAEENAAKTADSSTSASLIIDNGAIKDNISAVTGQTAYSSHTVQVKADDIESYSLTISGPTNLAGSTTVTGAGGKLGSAMTDNTWGYGWGDTSTDNANLTYQTFSTNGTSLESGTPASNSVDFTKKLVFAAKFGNNATDGHYTAQVNLNLVATPANVVEGLGFGGITKMQDMTVKLCQDIAVGTEGRLIDSRDGTPYWVAKLADDNCWMTQNLDLILENITLTPDDTDIASNKVYTTRSDVEAGNFVYTTPTTAQSCDITASSNTNIPGAIRQCEDKGWLELDDGYEASGDPRFYEHNGNQVVKNYIYDAHYKIGNYYHWSAATAGSLNLSEDVSGVASYSICPKGWRLPAGDTGIVGNTAFYGLAQKYGVSSSLTNGSADIRLAPLYFFYSGSVGGFQGDNVSIGATGSYLTSSGVGHTTGGIMATQMLNISSSATSFVSGGRFNSYQVRCYVKAKTGGTTAGGA